MTALARFGRIAGWTVWLTAVVLLGSRWMGNARASQQPADDPRFTGVSTSLDSSDLSVARRHFEAGARSAWHRHTRGQVLYVEKGRARTQKRGMALREMGPGDADYTAPDVEHWHGAAPGEAFVQVNVGFGGETIWLEKVTDEQYAGR